MGSYPGSSNGEHIDTRVATSVPLPFGTLATAASGLLSTFLPVATLFSSWARRFTTSVTTLSDFPLLFSYTSTRDGVSSVLFGTGAAKIYFFTGDELRSTSSLGTFLGNAPTFFTTVASTVSDAAATVSIFSTTE